jgi:DUF4097 and DUF4098 domain-containing protein YvlB
MKPCHHLVASISLLTAAFFFSGCEQGPAAGGSFERTFPASGHLRIELANASGDVQITGSADAKIHIHADVTASGMGFDQPKKRVDETLANPPVEQKGDVIRIGKDVTHLQNISISYRIEVPRDTEVDSSVASGAQTITNLRGPIKANSASGSIRVEHIDRDAQLTAVSGSIDASDIGEDVHANNAAGNVNITAAKGVVRVTALSGSIMVQKPGSRVEADTASGSIDVKGASNDVRARNVSGGVNVQGNPASNSFWELKTVSGAVQLGVPASSNFHLTAEATSGEIRTDIPIVIEEQGKHTLRAHIGNGGGRIEIHTTSGEIRVTGSN